MLINKIKTKLVLAFLTLLVLSAATTTYSYFTIQSVRHHFALIESFDEVLFMLTQAKVNEQEFQLYDVVSPEFYETDTSENHLAALQLLDSARQYLNILQHHTVIDRTDLEEELAALQEAIDQYSYSFTQLVAASLERGFKNWGMIGQMRSSIHAVEQADFEHDQAYMLMLRRHEKDFLLRRDPKYLDKFRGAMQDFNAYLAGLRAPDGSNDAKIDYLLQRLTDYQEKFAKVVNFQQVIGTDQSSGLLAELKGRMHTIEVMIPALNERISVRVKKVIRQDLLLFLALFVFQVVICVGFGVLFAESLSKRIQRARDFIVTMASGHTVTNLKVDSKDELGQAYEALNRLANRIDEAAGFATKIGSGQLDVAYSEAYKDGRLAKSLLHMQSSLQQVKQEEEERQDYLSRLNHLGDVIRKRYDSLQGFAQEVTAALVKALNANQGALFVAEYHHDHPQLRLEATYAFNKLKKADLVLYEGEGLPGRCMQEQDTLFFTEVPAEYIKITSGLGHALPRCVLLVPLMMEGRVYGVLELASFDVFTKRDMELVQKACDNMASVIRYTDFSIEAVHHQ